MTHPVLRVLIGSSPNRNTVLPRMMWSVNCNPYKIKKTAKLKYTKTEKQKRKLKN